ncbi:transglycosylase [Rhodanobacter sp. FW510-R12]|nr:MULTISPECIES: GlsB/YeaQ/YmgE family stress response membrane protein [unclassified Rhodanobacter]KZC17511.1 transglycosylase [Rhodanobacter sp. FW104-R8]KZC28452.1 transglycosylase [Rhodanobacter sp. FW510-T8]KZC32519.1 transglycosylase [Rhodanobacter sp. FW510-R10]
MFHLIWSIIVGFFVGLIGKFLLVHIFHADIHLGFWLTAIVGIVGSVIGGLIGRMISAPPPDSKFHTAGFLMSIVGAVILLLVVHFVVH